MTSLSMWKLSATRAMLLVRLPTMSSTSMKEAVMASIPSSRGFDPHPVQLNVFGNFISPTMAKDFPGLKEYFLRRERVTGQSLS